MNHQLFLDSCRHLRGFMSRQVNCMKESDLQALLESSFDLIEELKEYRYQLSVALHNRLSESRK